MTRQQSDQLIGLRNTAWLRKLLSIFTDSQVFLLEDAFPLHIAIPCYPTPEKAPPPYLIATKNQNLVKGDAISKRKMQTLIQKETRSRMILNQYRIHNVQKNILSTKRLKSTSRFSTEIKIKNLRRVNHEFRMDDPSAVVNYWCEHVARAPWFDPEREMAVSFNLDTQYHVLGFSLVSIGTLNESIVHARDVFRAAIALNCYAVVMCHNHPSGSLIPSYADSSLTRRLFDASKIVNISLLDHVIIGGTFEKPFYYSFKVDGFLKDLGS